MKLRNWIYLPDLSLLLSHWMNYLKYFWRFICLIWLWLLVPIVLCLQAGGSRIVVSSRPPGKVLCWIKDLVYGSMSQFWSMFLHTRVTVALWLLDPAFWTSADALTREPPKCAVRVCSVLGPSDGQKLVGVLHAVGKIQMGKTFSSTAMVDSVKTGAEVLKNCKDLCSSRWRKKDLWVCEVWMEVWRMCEGWDGW